MSMTFDAKKSAGAGLRNCVLGLCACLMSSMPAFAVRIALRCTDTIAYVHVQDPNTNIWVFEFIENGGSQWTWCGNWVTGNTEAAFYRNPASMIFRARRVD